MYDLRALRARHGLSQAETSQLLGKSPKTVSRWESGACTPREAFELLQYKLRERQIPLSPREHAFRFIDLFAGIGGLRRGFEAIGGECVFTSEWDQYAQQTYRANYGETHPIAGDITKIESDVIPPHDVLLAGFPCQPFSIAGVSKKNALGRPHGFACDTQGTLFFDVARIIRDKRPRAFLLENVKNLRSHDKGRTWQTILAVLRDELGYYVPDPIVVDAKGYVPQHRERIFIAGFLDHNDFDFRNFTPADPAKGPTLASILHPEDGSEDPEPPYTGEGGKVEKKYVLTGHLWRYLRRYAAKHRSAGNGFGYGLVGPENTARTLSARYYKDGSEILIRRGRGIPRRLTPRECARLMGFDEPGRPPFKIPVSDTRAYKQFGNAVVIPVVRAIAQYMEPYIRGATNRGDQLLLELARAG